MVLPVLAPFPYNMTPMNNIAAPTYRDGVTYTRALEEIKAWLNEVLVPGTNDAIADIFAQFEAGLANAENTVTQAQGGWQVRFDELMADLTAQIAVLNDAAVAGLIGDSNSGVRAALRKVMGRVTVDQSFGDGVTDATAHLQSRVDLAVALGLELFIPGGRYRITATLNIPSRLTIRGAGQGVTIIDVTGLGATLDAPKTALQAIGTVSAEMRYLTADAAKGAKTVNVADASTYYAVGDRVLLSSDQAFHVSTVKRGEIKRVEAVTATTVTFEDSTYDSYDALSNAKLQKMTMVRDITLDGFTVEGTDVDNMERGFYVYAGENINVNNCEFRFMDWNSVNLRQVINFKVTRNTFRNVHWVSNIPNYYGLVVENATSHGLFAHNHGTKCRHLFTTGYTTTVPGVSRYVEVDTNVDTYSQSASYDTHDGSEHITFTGNTSSYSEANGINVEARNVTVTNNIITNHGTIGIYVRGAAENVTVSENKILNPAAGQLSIVVRDTYASWVPRRIKINENFIENASNHCIYVYSRSENVTISQNEFIGTLSTYAIRVHGGLRTKVLGNTGTGGTNAFVFLQDCKKTIVANNHMGAHAYGVRMAETVAGTQQDTIISANDFTEIANVAVYLPLGTRKVDGNLGNVANDNDILVSPNGTKHVLSVTNTGNLVVTSI